MKDGTMDGTARTVLLRAVDDGEIASVHVVAATVGAAVAAALEIYWWVDEDPDGGEDTPDFDAATAADRYKVVAVFDGHLDDLAGGELVERGDRPPTTGDVRKAASARVARSGR